MTAVRTGYGNELSRVTAWRWRRGYDSGSINGAVPNPRSAEPNGRGGQPANLDDALNQIAGAPVPAAAKPVPMDPKAVEEFKAMVRPELLRKGVPPDQIEAQLNAVVAKAQQGVNPFYRAPEPPKQRPPGFGSRCSQTAGSPPNRASRNCSARAGPAPPVSSSHGVTCCKEQPRTSSTRSVPRSTRSRTPWRILRLRPTTSERRPSTQARPRSLCRGAARVRRFVRGFAVWTIFEGGAPEALIRGWDPVGGMSPEEFARFGTPDARIWPANDGFPGLHAATRSAAGGNHHRQVRSRRWALPRARPDAVRESRPCTRVGWRAVPPIRSDR